MSNLFDHIATHSDWLVPFIPLLCAVIWFAIDSRWEAYVRRKNYQELVILSQLREQGIITRQEFDDQKGQLLSV